jgi:hypothetical protein
MGWEPTARPNERFGETGRDQGNALRVMSCLPSEVRLNPWVSDPDNSKDPYPESLGKSLGNC